MGFWDIFKGRGKGKGKETKAVYGADAEAAAIAAQAFGLSTSPYQATPSRGTEELITAYNQIPILRTIVHKIASNAAATEWFITKAIGKGAKTLRLGGYDARQKAIKASGEEPIYNDPIVLVLEYGNAMLSGLEVQQLGFSYFLLKGEAFFWMQKGPRGQPIALWPIPPYWIKNLPTLSDFRHHDPESAYCYEVEFGGNTGVRAKLPAEDVIFIKDPDPSNPYRRGSGIGESLAQELDTDEYIAGFIKAFFYNNASPSMVVSYDDLGREEMERAAQAWFDRHRGIDRAHMVHFTSPKPQIDVFPVDFESMNVVELKQMLRDGIRETFGVPPEIIGYIENSNRATIEAANFIFARWVLVPLIDRFRIAYQRQLVPLFDDRKILDYVSPVPEDKEYNLAVAQSAPYTLTINEWRDLQGLPPVDGGDILVPPSAAMSPIDTGKDAEPEVVEKAKPDTQAKALPKTAVELDALIAGISPDTLRERLLEYPDYLGAFGDDVWSALNAPGAFDVKNSLVEKHINEFSSQRLADVTKTTQKETRRIIEAGMAENMSIEQIAKELKDAHAYSTSRARSIAQTEVHRSSNFATWVSHKTSGMVQKKRWITSFVNSRTTHQAVHGEVIGVDELYLVGGDQMYYPGGGALPEENINCGCVVVASVDTSLFEDSASPGHTKFVVEADQDLSDSEAEDLVTEHEKATKTWQNYTEDGIYKGLQDQLAGLLEQLLKG